MEEGKKFNPAELDEMPASQKIICILNLFSADFEKVTALMESVESATDMAAGDYITSFDPPPMVIKAWRLAQLMQEQRFCLENSFTHFKQELIDAILQLRGFETAQQKEEAAATQKKQEAREKRNAARRAARAKKAAAKQAKTKPKPSQKKAG